MLLFHVDINNMIFSCSYLGHSGDTILIYILQLETKSGNKYQETIYKENLIQDSPKGISCWEYWIGYPKIPSSRYNIFMMKYGI